MAVYIALEDFNFDWSPKELDRFIELWNAEASIQHIAKTMRRPQIEVVLLAIDQGKKGRIKKRKCGLLGWEEAM